LAARLGLRRQARSFRGTCPACGYAGTFSRRPGRGDRVLFACASCGDRDAIADAMQRVAGGDALPGPHRAPDPQDMQAARARRQAAALRLWHGSEAAAGTIAEAYVTGRALPGLAASAALRFRGDCSHPEGGRLPALVALVADATGQPLAVHRTYLRADGSGKASVEPQKATLGPVWGGAIRLDPVAPEMVIGEGIETSASAGRLLGLPAWAAISAGNLGSGLVLPADVRSVIVAADADEPGERAAREAALRWSAEGRTVRIARPDHAGQDFNDVLRARAEVA
ncbi:MAG: toprim domain-containing protein, partial [Rhodospirillales bacterium]|nr:toprim domain-containing protein [Rhodospirillales bacterium]